MSFIELLDFIIYQHLNKRTKILPFATSQIAIYATSLIMFALPISKPRFKSIIFIKIALKFRKTQNFGALGAPPVPPAAGVKAPRPLLDSGGWGLRPQTLKTGPPLRISGYAPARTTGWESLLWACYHY